jgi:O-methyltransferase family protein
MPIESYIESRSSAEDDYLYRLWRATNIHLVRPHMVSGHVEGLLLKMLVEMIRPANVLEIGTFTGYSAISMSYGLPRHGRIYTFDVNEELEDFARRWIEGSRRASSITYTIGDVLEILPDFAEKNGNLRFDLAFIDGNKRQYAEYYMLVKKYLSPGGYILADNTLWDGHVIDPAYDRDSQTLGIRRFNDLLAEDETVEKVILPIRDGLTIVRKKAEWQ